MSTILITGVTVVNATGTEAADVLVDGETIAGVLSPGSQLLGHDLALLGDETARSMHSAARSSARRVINTLVTRYDIDLEDQDRT